MKHILFALLLAVAPVPAVADMFVWTDPVDKLSVAFPEEWMRQTNTNPETRLDVLAPQGNDYARCRVSRTENAGFLSTPASGQAEVTEFKFTPEAIENYLWRDMNIMRLQLSDYAVAGLGNAAAVKARADFTKLWGANSYEMTGLVFMAQHRGVVHVFYCEGIAETIGRWKPVAENILKSVEFPPLYGIHPNGYYRAFQNDFERGFPVDNAVRTTGARVEQGVGNATVNTCERPGCRKPRL